MTKEKNDTSIKSFWFFLVSVILVLVGTYLYFNVQRSDSDIKPSDLEKINSLIISEKPVFDETKGKNAQKWIEFKCKGYTKRFEIAYFDYSCVNDNEILTEIKVGDTISVTLLKSDMPDVWAETFLSKSNNIHSLSCKNKNYMDIDCRNKAAREDNEFGYLLCFIMAPLTFLMGLFKNKPVFLGISFDPVLVLSLIGIIVILLLKNR